MCFCVCASNARVAARVLDAEPRLHADAPTLINAKGPGSAGTEDAATYFADPCLHMPQALHLQS